MMALVQRQSIRPSAQERRRFQRVKVHLLGRYMLADRREFPCQVINMSPGGLAMLAPGIGNVGERVVAYLDHIGRVEGKITRLLDNGFAMTVGATPRKRDKLAAASQMVSLFIMDFAPGGTNIPHHHEMEEEIYFVLKGSGEMVAGGGMDGNEGRHPTSQGDAWFLRLNTTVGFYSGAQPGSEHDQVLAVRSTFPFPARRR